MANQSEVLAEQVEQFARQLAEWVELCPDANWQKPTAEGWGANVTARHAGTHLAAGIGMAQAIATGQQPPAIPLDQIDRMNAQAAEEHRNCTKAEAAEVIRTSAATAVQTVRGWSDEQLTRKVALPGFGGAEMSPADIINVIVLQSGGEHLQNLRSVR